MSKGKDFRAPRKRGFDDDGPMSYELEASSGARLRRRSGRRRFRRRSRWAAPSSAPINSGAPRGRCGRQMVQGGQGLRIRRAGGWPGRRVPACQRLACGRPRHGSCRARNCASRSARAPRAHRSPECSKSIRPALSSGRNGRPARASAAPVAPDPSTAVSVTGKVKWFDDAKGFGFVASEDGGKDVFVHISILGPAGISHLAEGQQVNMRVVDTPKGREAISLSL